LEFVAMEISSVLGSVNINGEVALMDAGIDSLSAVEVTDRLRRAPEIPLPSLLVFDCLVEAVAASCAEDRFLLGFEDSLAPFEDEEANFAEAGHSAIALCGMCCRLPAVIACHGHYAAALLAGSDAFAEFPITRWDIQ
jgi:hypothetical protein